MNEIKVYVKVFATLREYLNPKPSIGEKIPIILTNNSLIRDIVNKLTLPIEEVAVIFRNNVHASLDDKLSDGDVIGLFPVVGGG